MKKTIRILCLALAMVLVMGMATVASAEMMDKSVSSTSLHFEKSLYNVLAGRTVTVSLREHDKIEANDSIYYIKPSVQKYATITKDGVITGRRKGSVHVYCVKESDKSVVYARTAVKVSPNEHTWSLRKTSHIGAKVVISPKRIYVGASGKMIGELYVYNRAESKGVKKLTSDEGDFHMYLIDTTKKAGDEVVAKQLIGKTIPFKNRFYRGKYDIIRVYFDAAHSHDLSSGHYVPELYNANKGITAKTMAQKGTASFKVQ